MSSIREIYEEESPNLRVDKAFAARLAALESGFVNKYPDHIEFFGGTLTGVQVVRFTTEDFDRLYREIIDADDTRLTTRVHNLPDINPEFAVSSDIFAISCVWVMYKIVQSKYLDDKQKHDALMSITLYLNYRYLTSVLFKYFKYPADPDVARATYARLSFRFGLKAAGSWSALMRNRSEAIIDPKGILYPKFSKLEKDYDVVLMLNSIKGAINDIIKNIYDVFITTHQQGTRISSSTAMIEIDGEVILRDRAHGQANYVHYIHTILPDPASFVKQELLDNICRVVPTAPPKQVAAMVNWASVNYVHIKNGSLDKLIDLILEHAFEYLSENKGLLRNNPDVIEVMSKMRGTYTNSRQSSALLNQIKEDTEKLITGALGIKGKTLLASVRTAFCLYVILRTFTMGYYKSQ